MRSILVIVLLLLVTGCTYAAYHNPFSGKLDAAIYDIQQNATGDCKAKATLIAIQLVRAGYRVSFLHCRSVLYPELRHRMVRCWFEPGSANYRIHGPYYDLDVYRWRGNMEPMQLLNVISETPCNFTIKKSNNPVMYFWGVPCQ